MQLVELDHVLIAVADLDAAAAELNERFGLASLPGGRHPGWGTANRIVPLGDSYLELVAVVFEEEAARSAFGRWVAAAEAEVLRPLGWAVRTTELDLIARRLGLTISAGSRVGRDGRLLQWQLAGIDEAAAEPALPFFIQWGAGTPFPGGAEAGHRAEPLRIATLELGGHPDRLAAWLGSHDLPIEIRPGAPALERITLRGPRGDVVLIC